MPTDDRERQFERALARHLRDAAPDQNCPDAETLAAYHERTLPLEQMSHWKEHIAGCPRCQETLALVEQSEKAYTEEWQDHKVPVDALQGTQLAEALLAAPAKALSREGTTRSATPAGVAAARKRPPWRWVVPIGAIAAAIIVAISVHEIQTQHDKEDENVMMARKTATEPVAPAADTRDQTMSQLGGEAPPQQAARDSLSKDKLASPRSKTVPGVAGDVGDVIGGVPAGSQDATFAKKLKERESVPDKEAEKSRGAVAGRVAAPSRSADVAALPRPAAPPPPSGNPANAPAPQAQKQVVVPSMSETVTVESAAPYTSTSSNDLAILGRNRLDLVQLAAADHRYIVAPGEKYAWRVGDAGKIEHSSDHGKSWKKQKSGATADLTAGSATSEKVCWVVGKGGTILLSTDGGKHWKQVISPIAGDLGGIHASDASNASIWDVPNHTSFETNDGGATWKRKANE